MLEVLAVAPGRGGGSPGTVAAGDRRNRRPPKSTETPQTKAEAAEERNSGSHGMLQHAFTRYQGEQFAELQRETNNGSDSAATCSNCLPQCVFQTGDVAGASPLRIVSQQRNSCQ